MEQWTNRNFLCEKTQVPMLWFTNDLPHATGSGRLEHKLGAASIDLHTIKLLTDIDITIVAL